MNILLCGADGFLGRAITSTLEAAGHRVTRGVRRPRLPGDIAIDYRVDLTPDIWQPRLDGIDAVVNAIGILREQEEGDFERIHHRAPAALFRACAERGIRRVVQISALGTEGATPYLDSKWAADAALLQTLSEGATVLRPSLVFGQEGDSTRFFMMLASLPVLAIPRGAGKVQPIHLDDVAEAVLRALEAPIAPSRILPLPGPRAMDYAEWMENYRGIMGLPRAFHLPVPGFVMAIAARVAGWSRASLLCPDTWRMLKAGNCGDPKEGADLLERPLIDPADFAPKQDAARLRLSALAGWRRPMLQGVLAALWLITALVSAGVFPIEQSLALLQAFGLTGTVALSTLAAATALDALMGALTLLRPSRRLWLFQLALVAGYTLLICWRLPECLLHPFGPILKNLAVAALLIQLYSEETIEENAA